MNDDDFPAVKDCNVAADPTHLSDAQLAEMINKRRQFRAAITKYLKKVLRSGHRSDPKTVEDIDAMGE